MTVRPRDALLAMTAGVVLLAGLVLGAWSLIGSGSGVGPGRVPQLSLAQVRERVRALAQAGRFDEAESAVEAYLQHDSDNGYALLMLAELALDRPDPKPERALEWLRRFRSDDRNLSAHAKLDEGKACYRLSRYDAAESAWQEALRLKPTIPEAGWSLLDLYYLQGRAAASRQLALRLFEVEPDPHDRAQLLLELVRQDAEPSDPASIVLRFEPVVGKNPQDLHSTLALGRALVRDNRPNEGLALLHTAVDQHPHAADAWQALLAGLAEASRSDELAQNLARLPRELADSARFSEYTGRAAWDRRDWQAAAQAYRRASEVEPDNHEVIYRLGSALRNAGRAADAEPFERRARAFEAARDEIRALYNEANTIATLGTQPHPDLYRRLADLRERMGRIDEARAWYQLILRDTPHDAEALAALRRLDRAQAQSSSTP